MSSYSDFLKSELTKYKKIYADIMFGLDKNREFIPDGNKNKRCLVYLPALKNYIDMLETAEAEDKQQGVFTKLFESVGSKETKLEQYKSQNREKLNQLEQCRKCKCLTCFKECIMAGCNRCEVHGRIANCDNKKAAVYLFEGKSIELTNDKTGDSDLYNVLAIIQDKEYNQFYIITEIDSEKFILYYYPGINEDTYGEISDTDDFNFAAKTYEQTLEEI